MAKCPSSDLDKATEKILKLTPGYDPFRDAGDCWFDEADANRVIEFFETYLTHVKGKKAGQPFLLELWQKSVLMNLFGWKRKDGTRRYREAFIFIPRKNGKSIMVAGINLYMLFCDGEAGAEIYGAAAKRDQAAIVWNMARLMVESCPELNDACQIYKGSKSIIIESRGSFYKPISRDANYEHGGDTHCAAIDELHALKDSDLVDVLTTSMGARKQPLLISLTTSDFERVSICNQKHEYASKVRDGIIKDPAFLPVVYEATIEDDWKKEEVWFKANPNLGVSISLDYLRRECQRAIDSPAYQNVFKRLHLNIRTEQAVRWLPMDKWDLCTGRDFELEDFKQPAEYEIALKGFEQDFPEQLKGRPCFAGLDLASIKDLAAFVMLFPDDGNSVLCELWVPEEGARMRGHNDGVPYLAWARDGYLNLTSGNVIDYDCIRTRINELNDMYEIREIAIDRWNSTQLQTQLIGDGLEVIPFGQGFASMTAPTKELEKIMLQGNLRHAGHPVLRWNASNVSVEMDAADNYKPSKKRSSEKIDCIVALIMALGRSIIQEVETESVYDTRGLLRI